MPTNPAKTDSRPWRRFLRFSVRGMIVVVLVIAAWLGWLVRSARIQREAVAAIERDRGLVRYNGERFLLDAGLGAHDFRQEETWAPRWLVGLIGIDYFYHVTTVHLSQLPGGTEMVSVGRLCSIEELNLSAGSTEDGDLANLKGLVRLSSLDVSFTPTTDAGLVHMMYLGELSRVSLCRTRVTDAGLRNLKTLKKLTEIDLRLTQITDAGLVHLHALTKLSRLDLRRTHVTNAGVKKLQRALPSLTVYR
jgi:hypothetical protein